MTRRVTIAQLSAPAQAAVRAQSAAESVTAADFATVRAALAPRPNKYGAVRTDGCASKAEATRYAELTLLKLAGRIRDLEPGRRFLVSPEGCEKIHYTPDALYAEDGRLIAEDTKSRPTLTPSARIRMKLFRWRYPQYTLRLVQARYRRGRIVRFEVVG